MPVAALKSCFMATAFRCTWFHTPTHVYVFHGMAKVICHSNLTCRLLVVLMFTALEFIPSAAHTSVGVGPILLCIECHQSCCYCLFDSIMQVSSIYDSQVQADACGVQDAAAEQAQLMQEMAELRAKQQAMDAQMETMEVSEQVPPS